MKAPSLADLKSMTWEEIKTSGDLYAALMTIMHDIEEGKLVTPNTLSLFYFI